jgi:hypothetical protein
MRSAETFCATVESVSKNVAPEREAGQLHAKLSFCRTQLFHLQQLHDQSELGVENAQAREEFRNLIIGLMWLAFYAREVISYKTYRMLVTIESSFAYVLLNKIPKFPTNGGSQISAAH